MKESDKVLILKILFPKEYHNQLNEYDFDKIEFHRDKDELYVCHEGYEPILTFVSDEICENLTQFLNIKIIQE